MICFGGILRRQYKFTAAAQGDIPPFQHTILRSIDIQHSRGQVIDVRSLKARDIRKKRMSRFEFQVRLLIDQRRLVPPERLQAEFDEQRSIFFFQPSLFFGLGDQRPYRRMEDISFIQYRHGFRTQLLVDNKFRPKERGENAEGISSEGRGCDGSESRGVDRDSGRGKIVVSNRVHAHDSEETGHEGEFGRLAQADRTVSLDT